MKKKVIHEIRTRPEQLEMIDGRGVRIFIDPEATIQDLVEAGARNFRIQEKGTPPVPYHYVNVEE